MSIKKKGTEGFFHRCSDEYFDSLINESLSEYFKDKHERINFLDKNNVSVSPYRRVPDGKPNNLAKAVDCSIADINSLSSAHREELTPEADLTDVSTSNSDYADVEEIKDYLSAMLLLGEIKIEGGFTRYDNNDVYAAIIAATFEGNPLPQGASTIQVDDKLYLALTRHQVLSHTNLHLRRNNDVLTTKEVEYYYVIDGEGELFEMPIDISDHNIYRNGTVDEEDVAKVVDLAYASTPGAGTTGSSKLDPDSVEFITAEVENFSDVSPFLMHNIKDNDAIVASITYPLSTQIVVGDADKDYLSNINVKSLSGLKESVSTLNDNGHRNIGRMIENTFLLKCLKSELLRLDHNVTVPSNLAGLEAPCDNDDIIKDMVNDIARSLRLVLSVPEKDDPYTPVTVRLYAERNFMYIKNLDSVKKLVTEGNKVWDVPTSIIPGIKGCMDRLNKDYVSFDVFVEENTMLRVALTSPEHDWATFTFLKEFELDD
ncbi:hypothetical protein [Salinivibrio kushneri]|uniref:hypothetical protein n=1 Tax=Salinivibrio kushneri TaxID=1908198 RepID=UPI0022B33DC1|nr:hypothetical protein [Salinivibrio kushneri]WBA10590.1 hypothetical protein O4546_06955 [Salinivibrio kushneri]WBA16850.1 hypothetical protein O4598_06625 [Salinivibrio kushneri]